MSQHPAQPPSMEWHPTNPPAPEPPPKQQSWFARHKVLTAILAVLALMVVVSALSGGDDETPTSQSAPTQSAEVAEPADQPASEETTEEPAQEATEEPPAAPDQAGIGDPVRDGKFEFVVTGVEDGGTEIGDDFLGETAQGRFHLVHLTVTNIGDEAQMMFDSNQRVRDEQGRTFDANSTAGIYLDGNELWLEDINPGNSVSGTLVFDMPDGASPLEIELHDSAFSGGVTVVLS